MTKIDNIILAVGITCLAIVGIANLTGCEYEPAEVTPTIQSVQMEYSDFKLITDKKTGIVYIDNVIETYKGNNSGTHYFHVYTPYHSENGKLCRFVDGKVVEIE